MLRSQAARTAIAGGFFLTGLIFGSWASRIPAIKAALGLTDGQLAMAFVGLNGGALIGLQAGAALVPRVGSRLALRISLPVFALLLVPLAVAPNLPVLIAALAVSAGANSVIDVAINVNGVTVERRYGRAMLSKLHAMLTLGGIAGAGGGALAAQLSDGVLVHFGVIAAVGGAAALVGSRWLAPDDSPTPSGGARAALADGDRVASSGGARTALADGDRAAVAGGDRVVPSGGDRAALADGARAAVADGDRVAPSGAAGSPAAAGPSTGWLFWLGGLAFCVILAEGSANDWAAVYLHEIGASQSLAAGGVAAFLAAMTVGRLAGDRLRAKLPAVALFRGAALVAAAGLGMAVLLREPVAGLLGFALLGLGLSVTLPVVLGAASHRAADAGQPPAAVVARVSTVGYLGSFTGPALIGVLATVFGLGAALLLAAAAVAVAALAAGVLSAGVPSPAPGSGAVDPGAVDRRP